MTSFSGIAARGPLGTIRRTISSGMRDERGIAAVEFAVIFTLLAFIIGGIVDFSRYMWARTALQEVVADAGRCEAIYTANLNYFTSSHYTIANQTDIVAPCSMSLSTYSSNLAAGRGAWVTITATPTTSTTCNVAISSSLTSSGVTTTYHTFFQVVITATFQSIFGWTPHTIGTTVCFPYCNANCSV